MNKILLGIGALVLTLSFVGEASAAPRHGRRSFGRTGFVRKTYTRTYFGKTPYHLKNGVRFKGGFYFSGRNHFHFSHRVWSPTFRRFHYFDPFLQVYYFFDPITGRYL